MYSHDFISKTLRFRQGEVDFKPLSWKEVRISLCQKYGNNVPDVYFCNICIFHFESKYKKVGCKRIYPSPPLPLTPESCVSPLNSEHWRIIKHKEMWIISTWEIELEIQCFRGTMQRVKGRCIPGLWWIASVIMKSRHNYCLVFLKGSKSSNPRRNIFKASYSINQNHGYDIILA